MNTVPLVKFNEAQVLQVLVELSNAAEKVGKVLANIYQPRYSLEEEEKAQALVDALSGISNALIGMNHPIKEQTK